MAIDCCCLAGNFTVNLDACLISLSTSSKTQFTQLCSDNTAIIGPVIGTLSITAYADDKLYKGCPAGAGVSMPWLVKYDCDNDKLHYLFGGEGSSYTTGDVTTAYKHVIAPARYKSISANAGSGPATPCTVACREEGYGLTYKGGPISFSTSSTDELSYGSEYIVSDLGAKDGTMYLQSFSVEYTPGNIPVGFLFRIGSTGC
jgi:hypothetical protein